ncbi:MAG TPA: hypothetical protein PLQ12_01835, partial [Candidatus Defluviicoccus seviourii]|nr:hypothetical protein [Candidatus Defluviicoccus seviourii]
MVNRDLLQAAVRELLVIAGLVLVVALLAGWSLHQGLREVALLALGSFIFWGWRALARYDAQG